MKINLVIVPCKYGITPTIAYMVFSKCIYVFKPKQQLTTWIEKFF